ncbi:MAG: thiolase family protein [Candidatus Dormibacteraeota bacterium]|uniref:Steroid 3-ketoacyl-CoA thiolase n=1 Tax=Candidatus Aeolococcus gillhamiae TaxID=3127015 RepID=A0A2W5ZD28_9BACT|nr:thiolase family protein [Candidatus Dormibacteraeota bacterium]PZR83233.1 MAG: steroid 3-ketoacyl-CoA thiolase [Candidatus Dormibacter sp. RRmetagenome_bin12]
MRDVVIVEAVRTPLGRGSQKNGDLRDVHPLKLAAHVLREVVGRPGVDPACVDDVVMGCVSQVGEQSINVARQAVLLAGFPIEVPATTVDRQCGSSQQAVHFAANLIQSGVCDVTIAAGVESMSRVPMGSTVLQGPGTPYPPELLEQYNLVNQGLAAEMIAEQWGISRADADAFATESHRRAAAAQSAGYFDREIAPVVVGENGESQVVSQDQGIRPGTTVETLAQLQPSFRPDGILHAGNSSQITDGASAILLMSADKARELGVVARATIRAQAVVGVDPVTMLTGPIPATRKVLERSGLSIDDIDLFEVNEAFAPVVLAWEREHHPDMARVNVNGGAIALGHPLGASGARLMTTLLHEMERRDAHTGLETMCCGGGLGIATIIVRDA